MSTVFKIILLFLIPFCAAAQNGDTVIREKTGRYEGMYRCVDKVTHKPVVCIDYYNGPTVSGIVYKTDKTGNWIERSFVDTAGKITYDGDSIYIYRTKYSNNKLSIENRYYYLGGKEAHNGDYLFYGRKDRILESGQIKMNDTTKIMFWKTLYNKKGNMISEAYYRVRDTLGEPEEDYSMVKYGYDIRGNYTGYAYYDDKEKLLNVAGWGDPYAFVKYTYDKDRVTSVAWYNSDSALVYDQPGSSEYAFILFKCDKRHRLSEIDLLGKDSTAGHGTIGYDLQAEYRKGSLDEDSYIDFSKKVYRYNCFGQIISEEYYDKNSLKRASASYTYFMGLLRRGYQVNYDWNGEKKESITTNYFMGIYLSTKAWYR